MIRKVVVYAILSILLSSCATSTSTDNDSIGYVAADGSAVLRDPSERGAAIDLTAALLDGSSWKLSDYRGQVLILNSWGPWCAPCRTEVPELQELLNNKVDEGLQVFGFATRTNESAVNAFLSKRDITYPQIADFDSALISQIEGVPSATVPGTIFIDKKGRVAGFALGAADISLIRNLTESLLEE
jgi:thiol-disulfide isomerase/thioredoxin